MRQQFGPLLIIASVIRTNLAGTNLDCPLTIIIVLRLLPGTELLLKVLWVMWWLYSNLGKADAADFCSYTNSLLAPRMILSLSTVREAPFKWLANYLSLL